MGYYITDLQNLKMEKIKTAFPKMDENVNGFIDSIKLHFELFREMEKYDNTERLSSVCNRKLGWNSQPEQLTK